MKLLGTAVTDLIKIDTMKNNIFCNSAKVKGFNLNFKDLRIDHSADCFLVDHQTSSVALSVSWQKFEVVT